MATRLTVQTAKGNKKQTNYIVEVNGVHCVGFSLIGMIGIKIKSEVTSMPWTEVRNIFAVHFVHYGQRKYK